LLRAHWIARVGMHSIYPDGVRWEKLRRSGPIQREEERKLVGDPLAAIERADNRATTVFAIGVTLASILIALVLAILVLFVLVYALARLSGQAVDGESILLWICALLFVPYTLLLVVDRRLGARLAPHNLPRRMMSGIFHAYASVGFGRGVNVLGLISSHHGERRAGILTALAMLVCMSIVGIGLFASRDFERLGSYGWFPALGNYDPHRLDRAHYDDQRDPLNDPPLPYVQSAVVDGDYLRLVVPYRPTHDIAAQRKHCADALAIKDGDARAAATLRCLASLHPVTLDDKPLADLHYDAGVDPRTDRPALVAMIDVRGLEAGPHVLRVTGPANPEKRWNGPLPVIEIGKSPADADGKPGNATGDTAVESITFWR
jgi:hypothetical protein